MEAAGVRRLRGGLVLGTMTKASTKLLLCKVLTQVGNIRMTAIVLSNGQMSEADR